MIAINRNPSAAELRRFASIWLPLFGAGVGGAIWRAGASRLAIDVWVAVLLLAALSWLVRSVARAVFLGLSYVTFPIGFVLSWIALAVVYFGVVTPIGIVRRARVDVLRRRRDSTATTFWYRREQSADPDRVFRQF